MRVTPERRVIAFDGDDTLWHHESLFTATHTEFRDLLARHADLDAIDLDARLVETERQNLRLYGYGIKGYTLSMVETAIGVTDGRVPAADIGKILDLGRAMLEHPLELIEGAREAVEALAGEEKWIITKGDLFDQEGKVARSGLADLFARVEIVSEKDEATYRRLLDRHAVSPARFTMVGNSIRSDILPVLRIGGRAIHVPYHVTWAHELVHETVAEDFPVLESLRDLPALLMEGYR